MQPPRRRNDPRRPATHGARPAAQGARPGKSGARPPGRIRIIAGTLRNSKLDVLDAEGLRPTPERVRETLFNWLAPVIEGARCLDLFAGTGALGIEAASRGAREVVLVERDVGLARGLEANLARLKVTNARVENRDALNWLAKPVWEGLQTRSPARDASGLKPLPPGQAEAAHLFDIVFVDPPFGATLWRDSCAALEQHGWLAPNALIYVESPRDAPGEVPPSWQLHREGRAGDVHYALYRRGAGAAPA
jgi:16S rRNA (guanine966-N2)-methyltransferase